MSLIPTIGIEMHCEMKSHTKVFSRARNTYSEEGNIHVSPLDIALPGTLPVLNKECVRKAIMASSLLQCEIPKYLYFDRKNYYYPDLPKGYQITQSHAPIGINGKIIVPKKEEEFEVLIHDIHLEEDTAQIEHIKDSSYINYNRAGVPLLELVTEPCFHSKEDVIAFLEYMRRVYQYTDISDADVMKGQIRCDVNISLSKDDTLGTKVEIKGVNSFSNIGLVIDAEIRRQEELIQKGKKNEIIQETRRWDEVEGTTKRMRNKADAVDYKYFVEPNIPKVLLDSQWIQRIQKSIPILPLERLRIYTKEYGLSYVEANTLLKEKAISDYYDQCVLCGMDAQTACNWITTVILGYLNKEYKTITEIALLPKQLKMVIEKMSDGSISSKQAKEVVLKSLELSKDPAEFLNEDLAQISDEETLIPIVETILEKSTNQIEAYRAGKTNLFGYFVGQVMKETNGKANPVKTKELLEKRLNQ